MDFEVGATKIDSSITDGRSCYAILEYLFLKLLLISQQLMFYHGWWNRRLINLELNIFSSTTCGVILIGLGVGRATKFSCAFAVCPYVFGHIKHHFSKGP